MATRGIYLWVQWFWRELPEGLGDWFVCALVIQILSIQYTNKELTINLKSNSTLLAMIANLTAQSSTRTLFTILFYSQKPPTIIDWTKRLTPFEKLVIHFIFNLWISLLAFSSFPYRAPDDGYYMFTLVLREDGERDAAGTMLRTPATDPSNPVELCRAEQGGDSWQTGVTEYFDPPWKSWQWP